jgi:hypothetical protein
MKWMALSLVLIAAGLVGCTDKPSLFPNSDPTLRKSKAEFAADAKKRFPYPGVATQELLGAAEVDVEYDKIRLTNLSDEPWTNIDVWVNHAYVVHVPKVEAKQGVRTLDFQMIYNIKGENLPTDNDKYPINDVEVLKGGTMYKVKVKLAY